MNLSKYISENKVPQIDDRVANGLVSHYMSGLIPHLESTCKAICVSTGVGYEFVGVSDCKPHEAFNELASQKRIIKVHGQSTPQEIYEMSHSDFYMVHLHFKFRGEDLAPIPLMLPYCRHGSLTTIKDTVYTLSLVIGDPAITVTEKPGLFVKLTKIKFNIERMAISAIVHHVDDETGEYKQDVVQSYSSFALIYKAKAKVAPSVKGKTLLAHYLFCNNGLIGSFKRYLNADIKIGYQDTINFETLDPKEYVIYEPWKAVKNSENKGPVMIAVSKGGGERALLDDMVRTFHYLLALFPERLLPSYLQSESDDAVEEECRLWKILLGHLTNSSELGEHRLLVPVNKHFESVNGFVDTVTLRALEQSGCEIDPSPDNKDNWFFDFLAHLMTTYGQRLVSTDVSELYNKRIDLLMEVLTPATSGVTNANFDISNHKGDPESITPDTARRKLSSRIYLRGIEDEFRKATFKCVASASFVNSSTLFRLSTNVVLQDDAGNGGKKGKGGAGNSRLHVSVAECGSAFAPRKSSTTGCGNLNPLVIIDYKTSTIKQNPKFKHETNRIQSMLYRKD